jgi:hypothetical protein
MNITPTKSSTNINVIIYSTWNAVMNG